VVIVVEADPTVRVDRLVAGRGMSAQQAAARIQAQATDEQRRAVAHVVIENSGSLDDLRSRVDQVWYDVLVPRAEAARAARTGR
jgi:dephospho-CoA kinase